MAKFFLPAIFWFLLSFWLLTLPGSALPHDDWFDKLQVDKWVHIGLFCVLCILFMLPFKKMQTTKAKAIRWFWSICFLAIIYGVVIEFVQRDYIPNRSFDIWDIVADAVGCIVALLFGIKKVSSSFI